MTPPGALAQAAAARAARESYGRLLAYLLARGGTLAGAEDALGDAFAAALSHWPRDGVPDQPEAWLLTVARRRLTDAARRSATRTAALPELLHLHALPPEPDAAFPDHRLGLLLACADPAVEPNARAALMLQTVLGLDAARVAGAFLVAPTAMAQRLVRAKRRLREAGVRFRLPDAEALADRLPAVLDAIYAAYTAGAADPVDGGALAGEAVWLAELCASLAPRAAEALGLAALLLHLDARRAAGRDGSGAYVPLERQDPRRWSAAGQARAEERLLAASALGAPGRFQWEAAIASVHAARARTGHTDWRAIVTLYDALLATTGSPVVAVNRAVAVARADGIAAGLAALRAIDDARLAEYQPYWAALAALAGDPAARRRAAGLATDPAVRRYLLESAAAP